MVFIPVEQVKFEVVDDFKETEGKEGLATQANHKKPLNQSELYLE